MMQEYIDILKKIFDPVAIFLKDEEFIVVVKDEIDINKKVKELYEAFDDELSIMLLTRQEYESMENKDLGTKII
ncbi:hypothetical protein [Fervidobacterium nodosum]|uniref:Uncharacterized protein n=1 Tax=Fervidobacterium nodosum (strain ATCC 35602 / DSM 5306 / Rt17-B1) TaxID=381764 RepID=A7HLE4_FERNB|nr:hypothetical protein [Fervidobacterium nodosum]ABS60727.1 hypothetical protein Fnod_0875 [Fervidobacterium nodosum Rt17-B1]PHJ14187.1 hypothetical protein IM41_02140 [Fervidobacterium sp. SC_NGM5_G05]